MPGQILRRRRGLSEPISICGAVPVLDHCPSNPVRSSTGSDDHDVDASKRSGTHNLTRAGYDEDKCRNVLVRYCAHTPRNFQYKDGIKQIFLILRDHIGDENLDLGGGVLYELIEVDCSHTDDPGAAFQRWRHDHMSRHADLELPHVPHMTTITASIIPTRTLACWRKQHLDRYPFVLSDSSSQRLSGDPSCIRTRKAWLIDHTFYVSSRMSGTRPLNSPSPTEFHQMQWSSDYGTNGKFIEEKSVPLAASDRPSETSIPDSVDALVESPAHRKLHRSVSRSTILSRVAVKFGSQKKEPESEQRRRSWLPNGVNTGSLFEHKRSMSDLSAVPLPKGCRIPNAIFARKYLLVDAGDSLSPLLPISQMPTAESKATDIIVDAANEGLLGQASPWLFRGPFTPQLGFDGGLDYQWGLREAGLPEFTIRRFDLEADPHILRPTKLSSPASSPHAASPGSFSREGANIVHRSSPSKRRRVVFEDGTAADWREGADASVAATKPLCLTQVTVPALRGDASPGELLANTATSTRSRLASNVTRRCSTPLADRLDPEIETPTAKSRRSRRRNQSLFDNIRFARSHNMLGEGSPRSNRKTTLVERATEEPKS